MKLDLTEEELDFIYTRCQRKAMRLEEAHLEDIPCYTLANRIMWKIHDLRKETKDERPDTKDQSLYLSEVWQG